jgi:hypothetical protein
MQGESMTGEEIPELTLDELKHVNSWLTDIEVKLCPVCTSAKDKIIKLIAIKQAAYDKEMGIAGREYETTRTG